MIGGIGQTLHVDALISNTVAAEQTETVTLRIRNGINEVVDEKTMTIERFSSEEATWVWETTEDDVGEYTAIIESEEGSDQIDFVIDILPRTNIETITFGDTDESSSGVNSLSFTADGTDAVTVDSISFS